MKLQRGGGNAWGMCLECRKEDILMLCEYETYSPEKDTKVQRNLESSDRKGDDKCGQHLRTLKLLAQDRSECRKLVNLCFTGS